jgi:phage I-like protein
MSHPPHTLKPASLPPGTPAGGAVVMHAECCREVPLVDGAPPARLLLAPPGAFTGRDGRRYRLDDPAALAAALNATGADLPLDWEHATELLAPQGLRAEAAAWLSDFRADPEGVTALVAWNADGARSVQSRAYRYYSPAYYVAADRAITGLSSVGLTNKPNLRQLPALNSETTPMADLLPAPLAHALALPADADVATAVAAVGALQAELNAARTATPELSRFVPRADYDAALNRAAAAETALRTAQEADLNRQVEALLTRGMAEARITPATVEYHRAQAQSAGGLERLTAFLSAAPAVLDPASRIAKPPQGAAELNADQRAIMAAFGNTPELLAKHAGAMA